MGVKIQRIAACFEGTWNTDKSNTNVSRLFRRIANEGTGCPEQSRFYDEGVGTRLGERIRSGMLGIGLDANIRQGYAWLASHYNRLADLHAGASSRSTVPARPQEFRFDSRCILLQRVEQLAARHPLEGLALR